MIVKKTRMLRLKKNVLGILYQILLQHAAVLGIQFSPMIQIRIIFNVCTSQNVSIFCKFL